MNQLTGDPMLGRAIAGGKYQIVRTLGEGGMGAVYQALQPAMNRMVALKLIRPEMGVKPDAVQRFHKEMMVSAKIEHPNTIRVYDFGEDQGQLYLAMELLSGQSLRQVIDEAGKLGVARIVRIGKQVVNALGAIHQHGVVHRDLKPDNVMLVDAVGERDFVKVLDFGIAKSLDDDVQLTATGRPIGTPAYMSPEQALGKKVDHRTDLYSFGVMLYRMVSGRAPFDAPTMASMLIAHATEVPTPVRALAPETSPMLGALIMQLLEKEPSARPSTAAEVAARLDACLDEANALGMGGGIVPTVPIAALRAPGRKLPWFVLAGGLIVAVGGAVTYAVTRHEVKPTPPAVKVVENEATVATNPPHEDAGARKALDELLGRTEPLAPEACRTRDAGTIAKLQQAAQALLVDGRGTPSTGSAAGGQRGPIDAPSDDATAEALRVLADVSGPSAEVWALRSRALLPRAADEAERAAAESLTLCPSYAVAHNLQGNALQKLGQAPAAEDAYVRALTAAPSYDAPRYNLGLLQVRQHDATAISTFTELLRRRPDHPNAHLARAQAYATNGKLALALADLEEAVKRQPESADAWAALGELRAKLARGDANAAYCRAKELGKAGARCKPRTKD